MTAPKETLWVMDPHTKAKHEILGRYLKAWFPILSKWHNRIVYIDGFCGPGRYKAGEPGSPLIALDVAVSHRKTLRGEIVFWFIDEKQDRIDHLRQELEHLEIPTHFTVIAETGRFQEKFGEMLNYMERGSGHLAPTFAFIDPFGFSGIPFSLIARLLRHQRCEVFITFMVDAINRFLKHPEDKVVQHIVEAFGTADAICIAKESGNRVDRLRELYQSKLAAVSTYVRYFEMRDRQDRTQYYLFFATNHELGHLKMKEAMWHVDPDGDFSFSDATDRNQLVLFEADTTSLLANQLQNQFMGKGVVTCLEVRRFVEDMTPFLKKHMTAALRQQENCGKIAVDIVKMDGKKRITGTYPDGAKLRFL